MKKLLVLALGFALMACTSPVTPEGEVPAVETEAMEEAAPVVEEVAAPVVEEVAPAVVEEVAPAVMEEEMVAEPVAE